MVPVFSLVGRKNVGKSTLFNFLTRTRNALVSNFPGLTRDRQYGYVKYEKYEFICIDTGGVDSTINDKKNKKINCTITQSILAIKESNAVLFIVDARSGLVPDDFVILRCIRCYEKKIFLIINKIDGILDINQSVSDFWSLGFKDVYPISASHGQGVVRFLESALFPFISKTFSMQNKNTNTKCFSNQHKTIIDRENVNNISIKLAIVGRPNVGKSTLTNYLLGENRVVVCSVPGTTRDSIYIPTQYDKQQYVLIDTAGVRRRKYRKNVTSIEILSTIKTLQSIKSANVVLLVLDAQDGISDQDLSLLSFILDSGRSLVIALNKWDILNKENKKNVIEMLNHRLSFIDFIRINFVSALYSKGIKNLFHSIYEAYANSTRRVSTALLTNIMHMAVKAHQPPLVHCRRIKFKYAHAGGYNPPTIIIHTSSQIQYLPDTYIRYLVNYFRNSLNLIGTPVRIQFKKETNPYINKDNIFIVDNTRYLTDH